MDSNDILQQNADQNAILDQAEAQAGTFQLKDFFFKCLRLWPWFIISILICCAIGVFYGLKQQPVYSRTASVMIKNQNSGASSDVSNAFASMGLVTSSTDVDNELFAFTSPAIMDKVVKRLRLNMSYDKKGKFHPTALYGSTLPIDVELPDMKDEEYGAFEVTLSPDGKCTLRGFEKMVGDKLVEYNKSFTCKTGFETHKSPLGRLIIRPNASFGGHLAEEVTIKVYHTPFDAASGSFFSRLKGSQPSKYADVIDLMFTDVNTERATAVLNTLIEIYNEEWVEDKNQVAVATSRFIHDRLGVIENELGNVDSDISNFKTENLVPDVQEASSVYLSQSVNTDQNILDLNNRLAMARYVSEYLNNPAYVNAVIPANTGIGDLNIENQIAKYNTMLLDRNNYAASSSAAHPVVQEYDASLKGLREAIVKAVNGQVVALSTSLRNTETSLNDSRSQIASAPGQAKYLLSAERQQKVKESLYMFLLQKLEENEMTQAFTAYNTRVITPPTGSNIPIAPKKGIIIIISFIIGLLIPAVYVFIMQSLDTRVHSREDLQGVPLPYAGEIPIDPKSTKKKFFKNIFKSRRKRKEEEEVIPILVQEGSRNVLNEAFRVARNNVEFMTSKQPGTGNVYLTTSFNPGSGKSFVITNLASSFALKHAKVLVIDGDMRHGSTSMVVGSPNKGMGTFLKGDSDEWKEFVVHVPNHPGLDILPVGKMPPNPAELLESPRLRRLLNEAKQCYDYIFIDCPPINVVVDTMIFSRYADRSIFVVRAGLFSKSQIKDLVAVIREQPLNHLCLILNGTTPEDSTYYGKSYYGRPQYYTHFYTEE